MGRLGREGCWESLPGRVSWSSWLQNNGHENRSGYLILLWGLGPGGQEHRAISPALPSRWKTPGGSPFFMPGGGGGDRQLACLEIKLPTHPCTPQCWLLPAAPAILCRQIQQGPLCLTSLLVILHVSCLRVFSFSIENARYLE